MKRRISLSKLSLSVSLSLSLFFGNIMVPALAVSSLPTSSETSQLDQYEKSTFGETHDKLSTSTRLKDLERTLFGTTHSGDTQTRLEEISKALGTKKVDLLLPAIAPQLDTTDNKSGNGNESDEAPAVASQSDREKAMLKQALSMYQGGKTAEAERLFKNILALDFRNVDAYYNLGVIAEGKGDLQTALKDYKAASNINPSDSDFKDAIASVQNKIDQQAATSAAQVEQQKQQVSAQKLQQLQAMTAQASAAYKVGNFDQTIGLLNRVAQQAPSDADVQFALAQAYRGKGNMSAARECLSRAISLNPDNQLYKTAMSQLGQGNGSNGQTAGNSGMPPLAPSIGAGRAGSYQPYDSFSIDNPQPPVSSSGNERPGQLTAFTDDSASTAYQSDRMRSGWQSGSVAYGGGSMQGTRLRRVMIGGASGLAMGALFGSLGGGGSRGMMRGAMGGGLMGSMLGLITGF